MNSFVNTSHLNQGVAKTRFQLKHVSTWIGMKATNSGWEKNKPEISLKVGRTEKALHILLQ